MSEYNDLNRIVPIKSSVVKSPSVGSSNVNIARQNRKAGVSILWNAELDCCVNWVVGVKLGFD